MQEGKLGNGPNFSSAGVTIRALSCAGANNDPMRTAHTVSTAHDFLEANVKFNPEVPILYTSGE